ncbi:peroxiredoxin family protein [Chitinophaga nivalis]|uniref:Thioredoxin domain-containing protein n=1 Tax=Chitinophaga nivalis TaxID=2991709 RepID=A0ABT3IF40_9BACT|nr:thioredoxin domain-containing protein [Chitinophaga nivalis]MCW3467743.1 thioredoxin domain-containing protein [Chitinophaga nivalis]MCW3482565.1 thioredoxin domain-containing protein [Chitinophaga nivalis]
MRYLILVILCWLPALAKAQTTTATTTKPPYLQYPIIPAFPLTMVDGHIITKNDLRKNEKTMVFVFSVDCDHCKHLTEEVLKDIDKFKKTQILMVTPFKVEQMKEYYDRYNIKNYPNIIMASEPTRQIMYFYDLKYFPGLYIYDKKQHFVKGFEGTAKVDSLLYFLNK